MTLEEALEKSGTANLVDDKTLQATKELIEPDEEILYALYTKSNFVSIFNIAKIYPSDIKGMLVITKNKILFVKQSVLQINDAYAIKIKDIKDIAQIAVTQKEGLLKVYSSIYRCEIKVKDKRQLDDIKSAIKSAQNMIKGKE